MVGANAGIVGMTKEHLGLALALSVPVFVVVTKIDMCPPNVLQVTISLKYTKRNILSWAQMFIKHLNSTKPLTRRKL